MATVTTTSLDEMLRSATVRDALECTETDWERHERLYLVNKGRSERLTSKLTDVLGSPFVVRVMRDWCPEYTEDGEPTAEGEYRTAVAFRCRCPREYALSLDEDRPFDEEAITQILANALWYDDDCKCVDRLNRVVDGLTVRECLERFTLWQRRDDHPSRIGWCYRTGPELYPLTPAQKEAARAAWSAQLKAKVQQAEEKQRVAVVVDDDRWEP